MLHGEPESLLESGAVTLFFPHGVGHMLGLGVRDAGPTSDEERERTPGFPRLRVDIPLEPRHAWTIEPGIYLVPTLLTREQGRKGVNWSRVEELLSFGGVRIEHDILITTDGCEILTHAIPV